MGPIHNNFISWWQTHLLRKGESDKMPRDLRKSTRNSYLLCEWRVWLVVRIMMFWILCFHSVCWGAWSRYEIQQCHCFIAPPANAFCWVNHNLQTGHTTTLYSLQAVSTFTNPVLYHIWLCSIKLKHCKFSFRVAIKTGNCSINP